MPLKSARLFFDLSEKVRQILESYFRLDSALYFSYSHLVCRSAIDGKTGSYGGPKVFRKHGEAKNPYRTVGYHI